jgi:hypothetical protein
MDAIQEALNEYQVPNAWWPIPLINAIQRVDIALAIPWVASCVLDLLLAQQHDKAALLADRIRRAVAATAPGEIQEMLDEYDSVLHPVRDNVLLSYRHLVQAKQFLLSNDIAGLRTQLTWALIFVGDCDYSRQNNIQFVINHYSKAILKTEKGD